MPNWSAFPRWDETRVAHVDAVHLAVEPYVWASAEGAKDAIEEGWAAALARNPAYFNGVIHLTSAAELSSTDLTANLFATDFKTYLHWRESGFHDHTVRDCFGSALIRSAEGHVILGRQRAGHVNGGLTYLPGGFIDARDVVSDPATGRRTIDIEASILREAHEETGLEARDLEPLPGFHITCTGPQISVAVELASKLPANDLKTSILSHIGPDQKSELTDIIVVTRRSDLDGLAMPAYAAALLGALFP